MVRYRVMARVATTEYQFIAICTGAAKIIQVYTSPAATCSQAEECLVQMQSLCRGKASIMGDLDCGHTDWDTRSNSRGIILRAWAARNGWHIKTPPEFTCIRHNGSSTVDVFLTRGHDTTTPIEYGMTTVTTGQ